MNNQTYRNRMQQKLTQAFAPIVLEIHDDSASHKGHAGHNPLGESHFSILIVSQAFQSLNQVARHREVYRVLADELKERVHALRLQCLASHEYKDR